MRISLIVAFLFSMLFACDIAKNKNESQDLGSKVPYEQKVKFPVNFVKTSDSLIVSKLREVVQPIISLRQSSIETDLFDLTYDTLYPHGVLNDNKIASVNMSALYWLKFNTDFRYTYGSASGVVGGGNYHFSESEKKLLMLDDHNNIEPKLWTVNSNSESLTFIGHPIIVTESDDGQRSMLFNSFANDGFLSTQKIPFESKNGTQVMMRKFK